MMYQLLNIRTVTEDTIQHYYALMAEEKRKRVDRFHFEDDKKRTVCGDMLARQMIAAQCGICEESILISATANGKPYTDDAALELNISHSGDYVLCAVSHNPIGVDIERIRPIEDNLLRFVCTDEELSFVTDSTAPEKEQLHRFFRVWTEKEAYFKYRGTGITELKGISIFDEALAAYTTTFFEGDYAVSIFEKPLTEGNYVSEDEKIRPANQ